MEKVICPKCNKETLEALSFCLNCKEKLPKALKPVGSPMVATNPRRHGFITFYIYLSILLNIISLPIYLFPKAMLGNMMSIFPEWYYPFTSIIGIVLIVGMVLVLYRKKLGFNMVLGFSIVSLIINVINEMYNVMILTITAPIFSMVTFYAVLQIKRNGVSCWKQLK